MSQDRQALKGAGTRNARARAPTPPSAPRPHGDAQSKGVAPPLARAGQLQGPKTGAVGGRDSVVPASTTIACHCHHDDITLKFCIDRS